MKTRSGRVFETVTLNDCEGNSSTTAVIPSPIKIVGNERHIVIEETLNPMDIIKNIDSHNPSNSLTSWNHSAEQRMLRNQTMAKQLKKCLRLFLDASLSNRTASMRKRTCKTNNKLKLVPSLRNYIRDRPSLNTSTERNSTTDTKLPRYLANKINDLENNNAFHCASKTQLSNDKTLKNNSSPSNLFNLSGSSSSGYSQMVNNNDNESSSSRANFLQKPSGSDPETNCDSSAMQLKRVTENDGCGKRKRMKGNPKRVAENDGCGNRKRMKGNPSVGVTQNQSDHIIMLVDLTDEDDICNSDSANNNNCTDKNKNIQHAEVIDEEDDLLNSEPNELTPLKINNICIPKINIQDAEVIDSDEEDDLLNSESNELAPLEFNNICIPKNIDLNLHMKSIILDASSLACSHGNGFSVEGILLAIRHFLQIGHQNVIAMLANSYLSYCYRTPELTEITEKLIQNNRLAIITAVKEQSNWQTYQSMLNYGLQFNGVVVSNSNFFQFSHMQKYKKFLQTRILTFTWLNDTLILHKDPYGRYGPKLETLLNQ